MGGSSVRRSRRHSCRSLRTGPLPARGFFCVPDPARLGNLPLRDRRDIAASYGSSWTGEGVCLKEQNAPRPDGRGLIAGIRELLQHHADTAPHEPLAAPSPAPGPRPAARRGENWTLTRQLELYPEYLQWGATHPCAWAQSLPTHLQEAARFLAYVVDHLYAAGPLWQLELNDVPDPDQLIPTTLQQAGMITITPATDGTGRPTSRWSRAERRDDRAARRPRG